MILYDAFTTALAATPRRDKRMHATCPHCKQAPTKRQHFSFDTKRYHCTRCHAQGTLETLAPYVDCTPPRTEG